MKAPDKRYVNVDKIAELAREGKRQLIGYSKGRAVNLGLLTNTFNSIERLVDQPLSDLPKISVETTISNRVVCMLDIDVLGYEGALIVGTGGPPEARWYRVDLPRAFALRLLHELEDRWLSGDTASDRRVFKQAHRNLKRSLGV